MKKELKKMTKKEWRKIAENTRCNCGFRFSIDNPIYGKWGLENAEYSTCPNCGAAGPARRRTR